MLCYKLLQSRLLPHLTYLNQSCTHLVAVCHVSCWPKFQSIATVNGKQYQYQSIVLNHKSGPLFLEFNWCKKSFSLFKKIANSMTQAHDVGGKVSALSWVDLLLIVRCQTGGKLCIQSLITTSSPLPLHWWKRHQRQRHESIRHGTIRLFMSVAHFEFVVTSRWFQSLGRSSKH